MRIAHYMSRFRLSDGGVVRAVLDICLLLAQQGHEVDIITWEATDVPQEWKSGKAGCPRVVEIPTPKGLGGMYSRQALREIATHIEAADVLHLHTPWDRVNLQFARVARARNVPYILTIHGMLDDWCMAQKNIKKRIYLALGARSMLERAAGIHTTAAFELEQARRWFPRGRGFVIPLVFDLSPFRELPGEAPARAAFPQADTDEPVLLFLSRIHPKKSIEVLIDAAAKLRDDGFACRVLIAGTGDEPYEQQLREQTKRLNLEDRVTFLGLVIGVEKVSLYERADLFVLPTSQENFGFVLVEALACRTPAVTTKAVDIWPELEASGGAVIIDRDADATAATVRELLADPERLAEMGEKGRQWVLESLDPNTIVTRFEEMYAKAAAG